MWTLLSIGYTLTESPVIPPRSCSVRSYTMFQSGIPYHETGTFKSHRTWVMALSVMRYLMWSMHRYSINWSSPSPQLTRIFHIHIAPQVLARWWIRCSTRQPRKGMYRYSPPQPCRHTHLHGQTLRPTPTRLVVHGRTHIPRRNADSKLSTITRTRIEIGDWCFSIPSSLFSGICIWDEGARAKRSWYDGYTILLSCAVDEWRGGPKGCGGWARVLW